MQNQYSKKQAVSVSDYLLSQHVRQKLNANGEHLIHIQRTQRTQTGWLIVGAAVGVGADGNGVILPS